MGIVIEKINMKAADADQNTTVDENDITIIRELILQGK